MWGAADERSDSFCASQHVWDAASEFSVVSCGSTLHGAVGIEANDMDGSREQLMMQQRIIQCLMAERERLRNEVDVTRCLAGHSNTGRPTACATAVASAWRSFAAVRAYRREKIAARLINRTARGRAFRRRFALARRTLIGAQAAWRRNAGARAEAFASRSASVVLQAYARRWLSCRARSLRCASVMLVQNSMRALARRNAATTKGALRLRAKLAAEELEASRGLLAKVQADAMVALAAQANAAKAEKAAAAAEKVQLQELASSLAAARFELQERVEDLGRLLAQERAQHLALSVAKWCPMPFETRTARVREKEVSARARARQASARMRIVASPRADRLW